MHSFLKLIITIRDFSYHWSIKQHGEERAKSDYKLKIMSFISGYVATIVLIVGQTINYIFSISNLPIEKSDPYLLRALAGMIIFGFPIWLTSQYLLKIVKHEPIPIEYSNKEFKRRQWLFWMGLLLGWFLIGSVGMFLTVYLRGGQISLFGHIWNQGGHSHTFEEDFGH